MKIPASQIRTRYRIQKPISVGGESLWGGACEYPDSRKILVVTGQHGDDGLRKMLRAANTVDYYDRGPF